MRFLEALGGFRAIAIIGVRFIGGCLASSIKKSKICDRLVGIEQSLVRIYPGKPCR